MKKKLLFCYLMLFITLLLVAVTFMYLSYSSTTEEALRSDKHLTTLNGPWKFIAGDNMQYAESNYDDSQWENMDLAAPSGVHDDDVGLSGYIPGWTAKGHSNYSGYAWYRLKVILDSLPKNNLAFAAPPSVDDAYQLFINGSLLSSTGNFSDTVPIIYSIQPRMFAVPENVKKEKDITIAFRVWMSAASLGAGAGGIHIAPTLGEKNHIEKKYRFQWEQTIKGYIVEVVWPVIFILLAITMFFLNRGRNPPQSCKWFIAALLMLIALFPKEISDLHIIPGIWFPYGVGVSRGQFFYVAFVFVMYVVLIQKNRKVKLE